MEYIRCCLCGADDTELIFKRKDLTYLVSEEEFCVVRCRRCGLVYVNPRPTEEEIHAYYTDEFYDTQIDAGRLLKEKERQLLLKYNYVKDLPRGKMLDVGCGKGDFIFFMQQKGWQVHGTDFSSKPPNVFGLDIHYGGLDSANYAPESFDLITSWAVFEHVYQPREILNQIRRLLKPGGRAVLLVTNFHSLPARLMRQDDIPRHTTLFTQRTFGTLLRQTGFAPKFYFDSGLFGGSNRGVLNYLVKLAAGEKIQDIVEQNRVPGRWDEFANYLCGKLSPRMLRIDRLDIDVAPYLDRILDRLGFGFIMIASATRN